jgi:hypothetical protein
MACLAGRPEDTAARSVGQGHTAHSQNAHRSMVATTWARTATTADHMGNARKLVVDAIRLIRPAISTIQMSRACAMRKPTEGVGSI